MKTPSDRFQITALQEHISTDEALKLFDDLEIVNVDFMMGKWKGRGFYTNHPMDGLLETIGWYGKEFISEDCVHPLIFSDGNNFFKVDPNPIAMNLALRISIPKNDMLKPLYGVMSKILKTQKSKARVRMMACRGKISATMIYDYLPINDVFRKVDENTVLGLMDFKGMEQPFFFVLSRSK